MLTEFLLARITEDEERATPQTCVISGGSPAPVVPNCIGPDGRGCPDGWSLGDVREVTARRREQMRSHSLTHAKRWQRRMLAQCEAHRRIVGGHPHLLNSDDSVRHCATCVAVYPSGYCGTLRALALPYADHPDFDEAWRP